MNFIKRTNHMEKQWQICRHDTMRFERRNEQQINATLVQGRIES